MKSLKSKRGNTDEAHPDTTVFHRLITRIDVFSLIIYLMCLFLPIRSYQ